MDRTSQRETQATKLIYPGIAKIIKTINDLPQMREGFSPGSILIITIAGIVLAEVIAMIFVYYLRAWSYAGQVMIDALIMTIIIFPLLYVLSFKPLLLQIQQQTESENIIQTRLRLMQFSNEHTLDELMQYTLDEIEELTGSNIGFFHFLETDQNSVWLQAWSTNTQQSMCKAEGKNSHYDVEKAGVWADAVRTSQPTIHNSYSTLTNRRGMPEGHAQVIRELVVPIIRDKKVVAILGVGNKPVDYTTNDLTVVSKMADFAWDVVENKRADIALHQSETKFRTLVEWTYDWEMWLDLKGNIVYTSPSCERITGYKPEEFISDPKLLNRIIHSEDRQLYARHSMHAHDAAEGMMIFEFRIIHRNGSEQWIEHICRPLFGADQQHLGRRVSNRDVTERKLAEQKIYDQQQKEMALSQTIRNIQMDIARDLHDTLGQNISYLRMNLSHLSEIQWGDPNKVKEQIQSMTNVANESYDLIRAMLGILRNGESYDPLNLFTRYANQVAERSSFLIKINTIGKPRPLASHQIQQLFFIFREALSNIEKYAQAKHVVNDITWGKRELTLAISDDGCGFDPGSVPTDSHFGLKFMRERAELIKGSFKLQSTPGKGTTISINVPYE